GLGSQLMNHLINLAREAGCKAIELTTALDNKPGQALYEKMGFISLGQVDNTSGDGKITKEWHMYYPIEPGVIPPPRVHDFPV
ncbi:MAG: GNAT family N-acetyltransferase, partial [Spirochaetaceae bacterium]|nr:GNAT family N-acetyltransferase [Spirochaetaceae bacterium]